MSDTVHIVCLDAPSPPDYGGVFDLYYKIPSLHKQGKKIILHYFDYKPNRSVAGLEPYCEAIYLYKRSSFAKSLLAGQPYIVHSRINQQLIQQLNEDAHPVLLEGIHCCGIIPHLNKNKKIILRLHNNEAAYYEYLAKWEKSFLKKIYLQREYRLLQTFQNNLTRDLCVVCVSGKDKNDFEKLGFNDVHFIPCFLPWQELKSKEGRGNYCLYHGNLLVSENKEAVRWLVNDVFSQLKIPLIIAGKGVAKISTEYNHHHIAFIENPGDEELDKLIRDAHVHVLPSFNKTGVKLKLLHALFEGRFCFTNANGVLGSGLEGLVPELEANTSWIAAVEGAMNTDFTGDFLTERQKILAVYNNEINAAKLNVLL